MQFVECSIIQILMIVMTVVVMFCLFFVWINKGYHDKSSWAVKPDSL